MNQYQVTVVRIADNAVVHRQQITSSIHSPNDDWKAIQRQYNDGKHRILAGSIRRGTV